MVSNDFSLLIVDDSRISRLSLIKQLNSLPFSVEIKQAASADEAESIMDGMKVDAALIDFNMPGRDGIQLAVNFQKTHPSMRIAIVTANIQDALIKRAQALGFAFIPKPTTSDQLAAFLKSEEKP